MKPNVALTRVGTLALCLVLLLLSSLASAQVSSRSPVSKFVGTWNGVLTPDSNFPPPFGVFLQMSGDGNVITTENDEFAISQGAWGLLDKDNAAITLYQYAFSALETPYEGTFKFRATLTSSNNGQKLSGRWYLEFFDPNNNLQFTDTGKIELTRVHVEKMP